MQNFEMLDFGNTYHVYNRGINGQEIFSHPDHYGRFLWLYEKYIDVIADTFAWCLMGNHFHLLVKIKEQNQIISSINHAQLKTEEITQKFLSQQFGHLCNAYSQSFNHRVKRTGGLFQTPFKRKLITTENYFTTMVFYIHNNPVKHGFCNRLQEYPWSSYASIISYSPTRMPKDKIIGRFDGKANFIAFHNGKAKYENISHLVIEEP